MTITILNRMASPSASQDRVLGATEARYMGAKLSSSELQAFVDPAPSVCSRVHSPLRSLSPRNLSV